MLRALKLKLAKFIQWQAAVGTQSVELLRNTQAISDRVAALEDGLRREIETLQRRFESFARLQMANLDATAENVSSWRRALSEHTATLALIQQRLNQIEQSRLIPMGKAITEVPESLSEILSFTRGVRNGQIRAGSFFAYLGKEVGLATTVNGHRLFIDTRDRQIAPHLATVGLWEPWNQRIFRKVLSDGYTVVEVGSNVGYFAMLAGTLVGDSGKVFAYEANPAIAALLRASAEINGYAERVRVESVAVSDSQGHASFTIYAEHQGDGHFVTNAPVHNHPEAEVIQVRTDRLDDLLPNVGSVRLLHLDVEGAEPTVLRGAKRLIATSPQLVLLMEWGLGTSGKMEELLWLESQGFLFYRVEHSGTFSPLTVSQLAAEQLCDVLCYRGSLDELGLSPVSESGL